MSRTSFSIAAAVIFLLIGGCHGASESVDSPPLSLWERNGASGPAYAPVPDDTPATENNPAPGDNPNGGNGPDPKVGPIVGNSPAPGNTPVAGNNPAPGSPPSGGNGLAPGAAADAAGNQAMPIPKWIPHDILFSHMSTEEYKGKEYVSNSIYRMSHFYDAAGKYEKTIYRYSSSDGDVRIISLFPNNFDPEKTLWQWSGKEEISSTKQPKLEKHFNIAAQLTREGDLIKSVEFTATSISQDAPSDVKAHTITSSFAKGKRTTTFDNMKCTDEMMITFLSERSCDVNDSLKYVYTLLRDDGTLISADVTLIGTEKNPPPFPGFSATFEHPSKSDNYITNGDWKVKSGGGNASDTMTTNSAWKPAKDIPTARVMDIVSQILALAIDQEVLMNFSLVVF